MGKKVFFILVFYLTCTFGILCQDRESLVLKAILNDDVLLLSNNVDSTDIDFLFSDNRGNALLHAIFYESPKSVKFLLKLKADPNFLFNSRTPLMYAVQQNDLSIVRNLVKYGAHVNERDSIGNTALMIAAADSKIAYARFLMRNGASLNWRNAKGYNARDLAVRSNNREMAAYLRSVFERNLPNYYDGPYITFNSKRKIKMSYFRHDSLKRRTDALVRYFNIRDINDSLIGFNVENNYFAIREKFERPLSELHNVDKLLVIGDIHGQYDTLKTFLLNNKIIDETLHWNFGSGTLVFLGDIFDRGEKVTEALWLIYRLEFEAKKAGGNVNLLLGNHELMEFEDDNRYLSEKYYYLFKNLKINYSKYYSQKTLLGRWLRSKNTFLKVDSFLFVHGGIHPQLLQYNLSIDSVNILINNHLNTKHKHKYVESDAVKFLLGFNGPFWYRGMIEQTEGNNLAENDVNKILNNFQVKYLLLGHTYKPDILTYSKGRIISMDVPFYLPDGCPMKALLLENNKLFLLNSMGEKTVFKFQAATINSNN